MMKQAHQRKHVPHTCARAHTHTHTHAHTFLHTHQDIAERIKKYTSSDPVPIFLTLVKPGEDMPFRIPLTRDSIFKKHEESAPQATPRGGGGDLNAIKYAPNSNSNVLTHVSISTSSDGLILPGSNNMMHSALPLPAAMNQNASFNETQNQSSLDADDSVIYRAQNSSDAYNKTMDLSSAHNNFHNNNNNNMSMYEQGDINVHNSRTQNQSMYDPNDSVYRAGGNISGNPALKTIILPQALTQPTQTQTLAPNNNQSMYDPDDSLYSKAQESIYKGNETIDVGMRGARAQGALTSGAYMQETVYLPSSQLQQPPLQSTNGFQTHNNTNHMNIMAPTAANMAPNNTRGNYAPDAPTIMAAPSSAAATGTTSRLPANLMYAPEAQQHHHQIQATSSHIHTNTAPVNRFSPTSHQQSYALPLQSPREHVPPPSSLYAGGGIPTGGGMSSPRHHEYRNDQFDHSANYSVAMSPNATERSAYTPPLEDSTMRSPTLGNNNNNDINTSNNRMSSSHIYSDYDAFSDARNEMSPEPEIRAKSPIQRANVVDISVQFFDIPVDSNRNTPMVMKNRHGQQEHPVDMSSAPIMVLEEHHVSAAGGATYGYSNNYNDLDNNAVIVEDVPLQTSISGQNVMSPLSESSNNENTQQQSAVEKGACVRACVCYVCMCVLCLYVCVMSVCVCYVFMRVCVFVCVCVCYSHVGCC